jgi:hypothetical protein
MIALKSLALLPSQRTAFLEMLAAKLDGQRELLGDGAIYRLCRELQRQVLGAPIEHRGRPRKTA